MNSIREIEKINEEELKRGIAGTSASWHQEYAKSPWVYVGNLDHSLSEGDVICVMSQFGEVRCCALFLFASFRPLSIPFMMANLSYTSCLIFVTCIRNFF